jgi:hypothetical protein
MPAESQIQPPPAPAAKALTCPSCGGGVTLRAAGYTVSVACQYCGSILDVADASVKLITRYHQMSEGLEIPLGTRGVLRGVEWEAIGHMRRSVDGAFPWEEYLLFNPYHGYRWLVTNRGGWSLGELLTQTPAHLGYDTLGLGDGAYKRFFADSEARVDTVVGEFYWRVQVGERVTTADWVRPGWMLSRESNANEVSWTLSELLEAREVRAAFGVDARARPWPPLPHQPSPHAGWLKGGALIALGAAALLILAMAVFGGSSWTAAGSFAIARDGREQSATLGPISFSAPYQRVELRAAVPALENGWVDLDYALVNRADQRVYQAYGAAERYSGRDSDGSWTEGSRRSNISIAGVPAGTYDLVVDYKGNNWSGSTSSFEAPTAGWLAAASQPQVTVEVRRGALYVSNLFLALILLAVPLLWGLFRHIHFEQARQGESDFEPTGAAAIFKESEDED